jgi:hypothetical protein
MIDIIKEILIDNQAADLFIGTPRRYAITAFPGKATICIGVRRCGKSTLMHQLITAIVNSGVSRKNIAYINFFDDRLHALPAKGPGGIVDAYYSLYPEKRGAEKVYFFFDELQLIPTWELFIDRLMRTENCEVYITGSSSAMLSREIATQMRGRSLSWEIFPFSFTEYLDAVNIEHTMPLTSRTRAFIQKAFENYWKSGAFPEVIGCSDALRHKIHQEYFDTILFRDIVERHDISHPRALRDLAYKLIDSAGSFFSINSLYGYLKSVGYKIQKPDVTQYLEWFEDCYFLFQVRLFDASVARSAVNPKKIYCIDHAFIASITSGILVNSGHLLENLVFISLQRKYSEIYYYKTAGGREVDFIVVSEKKEKSLFQVCETMEDPKTYKRETTALIDAMDELRLAEAVIITRNESDSITTRQGTIRIVATWQFLVEFETAG